ncbi:putative quinol monooxygenase [Corynebacterium sp.]|uniref:putative quinol monooxygenase n=1 Tax=Corynebacterium sp. TaxID=1720 RepID=UPI003B39FAC4
MISLTVDIRAKKGHLDSFLEAIKINALKSFTDEPGCIYFDVNQDTEDDHHFIFFEVYDSQDAVTAHRQAPHFREWRKAVDEHVEPGSQHNVLAQRIIHHQ